MPDSPTGPVGPPELFYHSREFFPYVYIRADFSFRKNLPGKPCEKNVFTELKLD
jgi:hypothetical protein